MFNKIHEIIKEEVNKIRSEIVNVHDKKIHYLLKNNQRFYNNQENKNINKNNLVNTTDIQFDKTESEILINSFKFNLPQINKQKIIKDVIIDSETNLKRINDIDKEDIRNNLRYIIQNEIASKNINITNTNLTMGNIKKLNKK